MNQISEVTTSDGMTISSNSDTQEELEAAVLPPVEDAPAAKDHADKSAAPVVDREPDTGKFTRKQKREDPIVRMKAATAKEAAAKTERDSIAERAAANEAELLKVRAELESLKSSAPPTKAEPLRMTMAPATPQDWQRYKAMAGYPKKEDFDPADYPAAVSQFVSDVRYHERESQQFETQRLTQSEQRAKDIGAKIANDQEWHAYRSGNIAQAGVLAQINPRLLHTPPLSALPAGTKATFGNYLVEQAFKSKNTGHVLLHLSNEQEVQRLATLPPDEVVWEIARIDASAPSASPAAVPTGTVTKPSPMSQAKPVFSPVAGSATKAASDGPPGDDATEAEVEAYYAPLRQRYRRGR